jgi:Sulfotransferase family
MIISHQHQFIFLKTQKTAGTSVELALSEICGPDDVITRVSGEDEAKRKGRGPQNETIPIAYRRPGWRLRAFLRLNRSAIGKDYYNHMPAVEVRRSMPPGLFETYKKITIVRNPWDREVSRYYWTYRGKGSTPPFDQFVRRYRYRPERKNFELHSTRSWRLLVSRRRRNSPEPKRATARRKPGRTTGNFIRPRPSTSSGGAMPARSRHLAMSSDRVWANA